MEAQRGPSLIPLEAKKNFLEKVATELSDER